MILQSLPCLVGFLIAQILVKAITTKRIIKYMEVNLNKNKDKETKINIEALMIIIYCLVKVRTFLYNDFEL